MNLGIRAKLTIPLLLVFVIMMAFVNYSLLPEWQKQESLWINNEQETRIKEILPTLATYLISGDYAALYETLDERMESNKVVWRAIEVFDEKGERIYPLNTVDSMQLAQTEFTFRKTLDIKLDGYKVGLINLLVDWQDIWEQRLENIHILLRTLIVMLLGMMILLYLWQNSLVRKPVSTLTEAIRRLEKGDFHAPLPDAKGSDEVALMTKSFENMRQQLVAYRQDFQASTQLAIDEQTRLRTIQDSISSALVIVDSEGKIVSFNPAAESMFGYKKDEIEGKDVSILLPLAIRGAHPNWIKDFQNGNSKVDIQHRRELSAENKAGSVFPIDITIRPMTIEGSQFFCAIVSNISEIVEAKAQLVEEKEKAEKASHAKSDFLAKMSHEIRTPMNGILGMARLLSESSLTDKQLQQVDIIKRSGGTLLTIINEILDLSKIESNQLILEEIPFDLYLELDAVFELYENTAEEKGILLERKYQQGESLNLIGDPLRIRQIVLNLVNNAIKFTELGSVSIDVDAKKIDPDSAEVHIKICDTGQGIPLEVQGQLFDPFKQADSSTTRKSGGTGLGLTICKQIVELMGGDITLESESGKGSCFEVSINVPLAGEKGKTTSSIEKREVGLKKCYSGHVLVVDDAKINQIVIQSILEELGFTVSTAENGLRALSACKENDYLMVLMDCEMPKMDGYDATVEIRKLDSYLNVPIIALTANAYEENRQKCLDAGMDDFLTKPIELNNLLRVLQESLDQSKFDS